MRLGAGFGNAILSRWPLGSVGVQDLPNREERRRPGLWLERRILQRTVVDTPQGRCSLYNTHWSLNALDRSVASSLTGSSVKLSSGPLILCGDLNAQPGAEEVCRLLGEGLSDAGTVAGLNTYPADNPRIRIDYVFTRGVRVESVETPPIVGSDHLPVVVDLTFETP
jgi:endonuclease/exonuclease/phosphatase family metal-dependent hydrolase